MSPRLLLQQLFEEAVASAQPSLAVPPHLPSPTEVKGRLIVIGAGKASAAMAMAIEKSWSGPLEGLVVTRYGYAAPCSKIEIVEAAHPVPDEAGLRAAHRMLELVSNLTNEDWVICLISGGASSLLPLPPEALTLEDKQNIHHSLLRSGASISEMNTVRRHLSLIKGGRLAVACHPARVRTLLISDVPGDQIQDIGSGPTVADPTTSSDALNIIERYQIQLPKAAKEWLADVSSESIKPDHPQLGKPDVRIISSPQIGLNAASQLAQKNGYPTLILGDSIEGESREVGKVLAGIASQVLNHQQPLPSPCVILSGGETTVTVKGQGKGGRNVEFLLSLCLALKGKAGVYALAADTDGVDGAAEIAGAWIDPSTLDRARALGLSAWKSLDTNDAHTFFEKLGDSLITGPTKTNINDFRAILIF